MPDSQVRGVFSWPPAGVFPFAYPQSIFNILWGGLKPHERVGQVPHNAWSQHHLGPRYGRDMRGHRSPRRPQEGDSEDSRLRLTFLPLTTARIPSPKTPHGRRIGLLTRSRRGLRADASSPRKAGPRLAPRLGTCWLHRPDSVRDVWFCSQRCYHLSSSCRGWRPPPGPCSFSLSPNPHGHAILPLLLSPRPLRGALHTYPRGSSRVGSQKCQEHPRSIQLVSMC